MTSYNLRLLNLMVIVRLFNIHLLEEVLSDWRSLYRKMIFEVGLQGGDRIVKCPDGREGIGLQIEEARLLRVVTVAVAVVVVVAVVIVTAVPIRQQQH